MRLLLVLLVLFCASTAVAQNHEDCSEHTVASIDAAMTGAKALTLKAAGGVDDTATFQRWFGDYTTANAEHVRATLKSVMAVIRDGAVTFHCRTKQELGCRAGEYAFVYVLHPYEVNLCPAFFTLPFMDRLEPGRARSEYGTREGTIIHELTHFRTAGGTRDHCYARSICADMARGAPQQAIDNADSYQYFAEDISFLARSKPAGKPHVAKDQSD